MELFRGVNSSISYTTPFSTVSGFTYNKIIPTQTLPEVTDNVSLSMHTINTLSSAIVIVTLLVVIVHIFTKSCYSWLNNFHVFNSLLYQIQIVSGGSDRNVSDDLYTVTLFISWGLTLMFGSVVSSTHPGVLPQVVWPLILLIAAYSPLILVIILPGYVMVYHLLGYLKPTNVFKSTFEDSLLIFSLVTRFLLQGARFLFASFLFTKFFFHIWEYPLYAYRVTGITPPDLVKFNSLVPLTYIQLLLDLVELVFVFFFQFTVFVILIFFVFWSFVMIPGTVIRSRKS